MNETNDRYEGACWNALMEEETKESIARLFIDAIRDNRILKAQVRQLRAALQKAHPYTSDNKALWDEIECLLRLMDVRAALAATEPK
jgi:hypothetical protein